MRVVIHEHGPIFRPGLQYDLYRRLLRRWRSAADGVIAVSAAAAERLVAVAGIERERIRVIRNAVDLEAFKTDATARQAVRRAWGVTDDQVVLGYVGRLDFVKGVDLLVEAFGLLQKESERYYLVLAGDGPQRGKLEERVKQLTAADHVRFLGFCPRPQEVMQGFDIGVVPSRQEALGIAALELMRMQVPLVGSGVEGMAEILQDEQTGLIPNQNSPEGIARCVKRLTADKALRQRLSRAAYQFTECFGIAEYVRAVEEVYREVLKI